MKNQLFLILVIIFYYTFFFSCKEKSDTDKYKKLFQQNSVTLLPDDSIQIQSEFSIELNVESDPIAVSDGDLILVKVELTDDSGDDSSDLPIADFDLDTQRLLEWGTNWLSYRVDADGSPEFKLWNTNGEKAVYTAVITLYSIN